MIIEPLCWEASVPLSVDHIHHAASSLIQEEHMARSAHLRRRQLHLPRPHPPDDDRGGRGFG